MRLNSYSVSMETLLATSSMIGHELEDRRRISDGQDPGLFENLASETSCLLRGISQRELFCAAPLDILVSDDQVGKRFHLLELNGTGIGGVTNMPPAAVDATLASLTEFCTTFTAPEGLVLLAVSGKESEQSPRLNRLMHEKLLFVDAMRDGLIERFGDCGVATLSQIKAAPFGNLPGRPTVVIGYIKELINAMTCDASGKLFINGQRVAGAVNDRFCRNLIQRFEDRVDLTELKTLNRCFIPGSDKGVAYSLVNGYLEQHPQAASADEVRFQHAHSRAELIELVSDWVEQERQVVIKPHGTGLGHGIEFFLDANVSEATIIERIDASLRQTEEFYGIRGGALPYTVCEYVDACRVSDPSHRLEGHKFELRVVVYRDGQLLKAMPSIAKIARERASETNGDRRSLINNITASGDTAKVCGTDYMLPLCNHQTLQTLGLTRDDLHELCQFATGLVRHTLDQIEDEPVRYGLPQSQVTAGVAALRAA